MARRAQPEDDPASLSSTATSRQATLDHAVAGVDELETCQSFTPPSPVTSERNVLKPRSGMTMDQWSEHIDEAELPDVSAGCRSTAIGSCSIEHARAAAKMRLDLGL